MWQMQADFLEPNSSGISWEITQLQAEGEWQYTANHGEYTLWVTYESCEINFDW